VSKKDNITRTFIDGHGKVEDASLVTLSYFTELQKYCSTYLQRQTAVVVWISCPLEVLQYDKDIMQTTLMDWSSWVFALCCTHPLSLHPGVSIGSTNE
jgi:hypothetical protein